MNYILSFLVLFILQVELCTSQNRYCQEAVDSVRVVDSCPTSETEWDVAARKKNCGRIASKQNCATVEKFQYHCVVNGLRNKLLEVCAPTRIIFGHCVEFNVRGGVIQDQLSAPCNATFPKCADFYLSSDVYKYPDCYKLVLKNEGSLAFEEKTITTTSKNTLITTNSSGQEKSFSVWIFVFISVLIIAVVAVVSFLILYFRKKLSHSKQPNRKHNEAVFSSIENVEGGVKYVYIDSEPCMEIKDEEKTCLIPQKIEEIQQSPSNQSLSRRFSQSETAVNNIQYRPMRQPVDQDIRRRTSTQSMSQRFARSDSAAYKKGYRVSDFLYNVSPAYGEKNEEEYSIEVAKTYILE